ncbi:hypothetical protein E4U40_003076 [Claviceps sp. LM458 group G5]|nr:hypothetical protein E4U40_003076 [Claviceps sp. LM458 group G5]
MLKLGYGAFATVWLARDLVDKRYVAVKVGLGSDKPLSDREAEILSQIRETGPGKNGYERVIELSDVFVVEGPKDRMDSTNLHIANIGIALPQLEQFEEKDIIDYYASPELIPVVPRYPQTPLSSMPPYIVKSTELTDYLKFKKAFPGGSVTVKIMGFGRAHRINKDPNLLGAVSKMIRPPEFVLDELCDDRIGSTWSEAADIWLWDLYDVKSGGELISKSTLGSLKDYLFQIIQFGGPPRETWPKVWDTQDRQQENCWYLRLSSFELIRNRDTDTLLKVWEDEERLAFLNFIKRMIITNPDERTPTTVLLSDPFMVERRKAEGSI